MKTVKAFDWWRETEGNGASVRKAWDAAQANMPTKTCEWYYDDDGDLVGCKSIHSMMRAHCSDCGGKVTIKQTTEQKLEAKTLECDALKGSVITIKSLNKENFEKRDEAENHLAVLVGICVSVSPSMNACLRVASAKDYIRQNGLEK